MPTKKLARYPNHAFAAKEFMEHSTKIALKSRNSPKNKKYGS
jgi:hypothetical protein